MKITPDSWSPPPILFRKSSGAPRMHALRTTPAPLVALIVAAAIVGGFGERARAEDKPPVSLSIFTRGWPNGYCELQWSQDERTHRILTNIDCSKLPPFLTFDSEGQKIELFTVASAVGAEDVAALQATGTVDASGFPVEWPKQNRPALGGPSQYLIGWDASFLSEVFQKATVWLDALHRYFDTHRAEILAAWQERERQRPLSEAEAKALEQRLRDEAALPPTQVRVISVGLSPRAGEPARPSEEPHSKSKK